MHLYAHERGNCKVALAVVSHSVVLPRKGTYKDIAKWARPIHKYTAVGGWNGTNDSPPDVEDLVGAASRINTKFDALMSPESDIVVVKERKAHVPVL